MLPLSSRVSDLHESNRPFRAVCKSELARVGTADLVLGFRRFRHHRLSRKIGANRLAHLDGRLGSCCGTLDRDFCVSVKDNGLVACFIRILSSSPFFLSFETLSDRSGGRSCARRAQDGPAGGGAFFVCIDTLAAFHVVQARHVARRIVDLGFGRVAMVACVVRPGDFAGVLGFSFPHRVSCSKAADAKMIANYSLKRTNQSLRDCCGRLAQALGACTNEGLSKHGRPRSDCSDQGWRV